MKYIPLSSLQNPYPSIQNYRKESNSVTLNGFYAENSLNIPTLKYDNIGIVDNTTFRFIVQIYDNKNSENLLNILTSEGYYNDLQRATNSGNPYFINTALNPNTFIKIYLDDIKKYFDEQVELGAKFNVTTNFNVIFNGDGTINYQEFGKYIDWVISSPELNDIDTDGVLPPEQISSFTRGEFGNLIEDREDPQIIVDPPDVFFGDLNPNNSSGITFGEGDFATNSQVGNQILLGGRPESNSPAGRIRNLFRRRNDRT